MEKTVDVVYVLGSGSTWNNNEIRYSLRSVEKNGIGLGRIFIVGELPEFLSAGIIHIQAEDIFNPNQNADGNIANKVLAACADERLSDDFLFINDDHIILQPIHLADVPAFHKGDMNTYPESFWQLNFWRGRLKRTMEVLNQKGMTAYHFDCHTPILLNKQLFPRVMANFPYQEGIGLTMKSLYGNYVYSETGVPLQDEKKTVFKFYTPDQLRARLNDCGFMSFNDLGLNNVLKYWLDEEFPEQSQWELSATEDKIIQIKKWLGSNRDYDAGMMLFEKYLKGVNLIKIFRSGETPGTRKKLEFKLTHTITDL